MALFIVALNRAEFTRLGSGWPSAWSIDSEMA